MIILIGNIIQIYNVVSIAQKQQFDKSVLIHNVKIRYFVLIYNSKIYNICQTFQPINCFLSDN